jgi:hypothetical protein
MPMFEILTEKLQSSNISLLGCVLNDTIKLKFGKRVSHELGRHLLKNLGEIMK